MYNSLAGGSVLSPPRRSAPPPPGRAAPPPPSVGDEVPIASIKVSSTLSNVESEMKEIDMLLKKVKTVRSPAGQSSPSNVTESKGARRTSSSLDTQSPKKSPQRTAQRVHTSSASSSKPDSSAPEWHVALAKRIMQRNTGQNGNLEESLLREFSRTLPKSIISHDSVSSAVLRDIIGKEGLERKGVSTSVEHKSTETEALRKENSALKDQVSLLKQQNQQLRSSLAKKEEELKLARSSTHVGKVAGPRASADRSPVVAKESPHRASAAKQDVGTAKKSVRAVASPSESLMRPTQSQQLRMSMTSAQGCASPAAANEQIIPRGSTASSALLRSQSVDSSRGSLTPADGSRKASTTPISPGRAATARGRLSTSATSSPANGKSPRARSASPATSNVSNSSIVPRRSPSRASSVSSVGSRGPIAGQGARGRTPEPGMHHAWMFAGEHSKGNIKLPDAWREFLGPVADELGQSVALRLSTMYETLYGMLVGKLDADNVADAEDRQRTMLELYACDWVSWKFGLKSLADRRLLEFFVSLQRNYDAIPFIKTVLVHFGGDSTKRATDHLSGLYFLLFCLRQVRSEVVKKSTGAAGYELPLERARNTFKKIFQASTTIYTMQGSAALKDVGYADSMGKMAVDVFSFLQVCVRVWEDDQEAYLNRLRGMYLSVCEGPKNPMTYQNFSRLCRAGHPDIKETTLDILFGKAARSGGSSEENGALPPSEITVTQFVELFRTHPWLTRFYCMPSNIVHHGAGPANKAVKRSPSSRGSLGASTRRSLGGK